MYRDLNFYGSGGTRSSSPAPYAKKEIMKLSLIGKPGSGKGTIASRICEHYGLTRIGTGDLLRKEIASGSLLGKKLEADFNAGKLAPTDTIIGLLSEELERVGADYVLDGAPRTVPEAEWLTQRGGVDLFLWIGVPDATAVDRMRDRRVCGNGRTYSIWNVPDGVEVRKREMDDRPWDRIREYRMGTLPILEDVISRFDWKCIYIDGCGPRDRVVHHVIEAINTFMEDQKQ